MKRILLFAPKDSYSQHITLLLRVANFDCISSKSIDEVLNWLSTDHLKEAHFNLLLLNSWPNLENRTSLFHELVSHLEIPVIYMLRTGAFKPSRADYNISVCHPEKMLKCINTHLYDDNTKTMEICTIAASDRGHPSPFVFCCSCSANEQQKQNVAAKKSQTNDQKRTSYSRNTQVNRKELTR